jgi:formylglycine-generating enzyme required for sulfatase activity
MSFGSFRHQRWHETANGTIEPPTVEVPQADVVIGMALFEGTESSLLAGHRPGEGRPTWVGAFLLDPTEITIEQYREVEKTIPPQLVNRSVGAHEPVTFVSFDTALDDAEKRGKRLPTELEYLVAATDNGKRRYPWGDSPKQLLNRPWRFGRVDEPTIDQTKTSPPVRNLYSNVAEWLIDWYSADPNVPVALLGPDYRDGRVVRGGPPSVVECNLDGNEAATGPEQRQGYARYKCCPGLGYRCARSVRPIFLK